MPDPFPPLDPAGQRARAVQRLRAAIDAAVLGGQEACRQGPHIAALAEPLVKRLEQIRRELDQMEPTKTPHPAPETHPFWTSLIEQANAQTPCGKSPPPENGSR